MSNNPWLQTYSGIAFDLVDPKPEMVRVIDVAHALAKINRFGGHTIGLYSVAQHSVIMARRVAHTSYAYHALMHDAAEAYIGDLPSPLQRLLPDYRALKKRIEAVVAEAFKVPAELPPVIREADLRMLMTEKRDVMSTPPKSWGLPAVDPYQITLESWGPWYAMKEFLSAFERLAPADLVKEHLQ